MDEKDKALAERLAIDAAVSEALANAKAKGTKVLAPHIRPSCVVKWIDDVPHVVAMQGTKETTVDALVSQFKHDPDFVGCFIAAPNPNVRDSDGIRRISVHDQQSLNRFSSEIAAGTCEVVYDEETKKKLDENTIDIHDTGAMNDSLEDLASGKKSVAFTN